MTKILLVDDDSELAELLQDYLQHEGFTVQVAYDGVTGLREALAGDFALVVLDVMLPGMRGTEVLSQIRAHSRVPVLMLTAKGDDIDRIVGLEAGADDYVPKPCTPRELVARVRAILRRSAPPIDDSAMPVEAGPLRLWPAQRKAEYRGQSLDLTGTEFSLLLVLASQHGQIVSKAQLSLQGLGRPLARFERSVDVHLSSVRHKLGSLPDGRAPIVAIRGQGYLLVRE